MDLHADLGESWDRWRSGEDVDLLDVVSSISICCGVRAGDADLMLATCEAAVGRGVAIGARVGCVDPDGSGQVSMDLDDATLIETVRAQIDALAVEADAAGGSLCFVKTGGALSSTAATDERRAAAVVEAVIAYGLPLVGPPSSMTLRLATAEGLPVVLEGIITVGTSPDEAAVQAVALMAGVETIRVPSSSPDTARSVRAALEAAGASLVALTR